MDNPLSQRQYRKLKNAPIANGVFSNGQFLCDLATGSFSMGIPLFSLTNGLHDFSLALIGISNSIVNVFWRGRKKC